MKISTDRDCGLVVEKVYNGVTLRTEEGNELSICMRDDTFEINVRKHGATTDNWKRVNMESGEVEDMGKVKWQDEFDLLYDEYQKLAHKLNVKYMENCISTEYRIRCGTISDILAVNNYYNYWDNEDLTAIISKYEDDILNGIFMYIKFDFCSKKEVCVGWDLTTCKLPRIWKEVSCEEWKNETEHETKGH